MEENLKKALLELLVLALLYERDYYIPELVTAITERTEGSISIVNPYGNMYRMIDQGYIQDLSRQRAPDGRRRQYFGITEAGRNYFREILSVYKTFIGGVDCLIDSLILNEEGDSQ